MGNSKSSIEKELPGSWITLFHCIKLRNKEIKRLYKVYKNVDIDGEGSVTVAHLLALLDIERTNFTERIFTAFDTKHSGRVDFREFVMSAWNYCTLSKSSLSKFNKDFLSV
jgi:Ca2+-binding EF-hand superfamily protein